MVTHASPWRRIRTAVSLDDLDVIRADRRQTAGHGAGLLDALPTCASCVGCAKRPAAPDLQCAWFLLLLCRTRGDPCATCERDLRDGRRQLKTPSLLARRRCGWACRAAHFAWANALFVTQIENMVAMVLANTYIPGTFMSPSPCQKIASNRAKLVLTSLTVRSKPGILSPACMYRLVSAKVNLHCPNFRLRAGQR